MVVTGPAAESSVPAATGRTVTFLFTDIEGSTVRWDRNSEMMGRAVARHEEILRAAIERANGAVFKEMGDGVAAAFTRALDALVAALDAQRRLRSEPWTSDCEIRVRMALHTGAAEERHGDYFGPPLNRVARLLATGHGGQTLLSLPTAELVRDALPTGAELRDLGMHGLKDLIRPEQIFQVTVPDLQGSFPPLKTLDARPHNLPILSTTFVGREREVAGATEMLRRPDMRLLTLVGPGGSGKTRLSIQIGAEMLVDCPDGVYFVPLASLATGDQVVTAIAAALGLQAASTEPGIETIKRYLAGKRLLLILDNFEHLMPAATVVGELLASSAVLTVLVTSQAPLRIAGEHEFPVPVLALPDPRNLPDLPTLASYDAIALFVERTRCIRHDFALTAENAGAVTEICRRLDGLPLALELAAARIRLFTPQAMLARLSDSLGLLTGGRRDVPARHQTLRGAIDWSYNLLDASERTLFARAGVFAGGFTLEAAEAVCCSGGEIDVLDGMTSLVEKSLVRREEGVGGEPRFSMLRTLREYALEALGSDAAPIRRAHAEYYLELARQLEPRAPGLANIKRLDRLDQEHDNFRAALGCFLAASEQPSALQLATTLSQFWYWRGYLNEGRDWLERGLAADGDTPAATRAVALVGLGSLLQVQGEHARATSALEEGLLALRQEDDSAGMADALFYLGRSARYRGDCEAAASQTGEALALYRASHDTDGEALSLANLGIVARLQGDDSRSTALLEEALDLLRTIDARDGIAFVLANLGTNARMRGDLEQATTLHEESVRLRRELGDRRGLAISLGNLALIALAQDRQDDAISLGRESLQLDRDLGDQEGMALCLETIAAAFAARGDPARALRLWATAAALRRRIACPLPAAEQAQLEAHAASARAALDDAAADAWKVGERMSLDEGVALALAG